MTRPHEFRRLNAARRHRRIDRRCGGVPDILWVEANLQVCWTYAASSLIGAPLAFTFFIVVRVACPEDRPHRNLRPGQMLRAELIRTLPES